MDAGASLTLRVAEHSPVYHNTPDHADLMHEMTIGVVSERAPRSGELTRDRARPTEPPRPTPNPATPDHGSLHLLFLHKAFSIHGLTTDGRASSYRVASATARRATSSVPTPRACALSPPCPLQNRRTPVKLLPYLIP
ncbi:hypothetical protein GE061_000908 [Apolygus lucorum]|uniref:Uncharacterized protein n=1 Tax=Apolygus lucorum TaxID=248454 RepID=A0A8S9YAX2_APOLU|nr:hypothetical protein GE061_000908 [Apolygus lucorum]